MNNQFKPLKEISFKIMPYIKKKTSKNIGKYVKAGVRAVNTTAKVARSVHTIARLASMLNAEKKHHEIVSPTTYPEVGQCNYNSSGGAAIDITPIMSQGVTATTRTGASIKLHSSYMQFQFFHQANAVNNIKGVIYIFQVLGNPQLSASAVGSMFLPNKWVSTNNTGVNLYDYNSQINPDTFGQFKIITKRKFTVKSDSVTAANMPTSLNIPLKYNRGKGHHIRFSGDTNIVTNGQMIMAIFVDNGNIGTSSSTIQGIPSNGASTGLYYQYDIKHYYYDN